MRNLILIFALIFSVSSFSQTEPISDSIVKKALYTKTEKKQAKKNFRHEVEKIGLTSEVKTEYLAIVNKYVLKITEINESRNLTKSQCTNYVNTNFQSLNQEIKPLLTPEQYNQHIMISEAFQTSVLERIEKQ